MIKTVNLTTAVTAVDVTGKQNVTVKNIGSNTAHVSASPDISVGGDDCLSVKAGEIVTLEGVATLKKVNGQYGVHGTVYALSSGATTIELIPTNSVNFKSAAVDYSGEISDISALIPTAASAGNQLTDKAYVDSSLSEKVDKVSGMGLSSNDYTTAEKEKLASLDNYDDTAVKADISSLQSSKVEKEDGKGLSTHDFTTAEKTKLASLENYTLPTASTDTLGGIKIGEGLTITDGVLSASGGGSTITYGTEDLTDGVSPLADGTIYFVYE